MNQGSDEAVFLRKIQRLLDEGEFVATYKFALLQALSDLSVESDTSERETLEIPLSRIAEKFIEYYWGQAIPFASDADGKPGVLMQNTGRQAAVLNQLISARRDFNGKLALAKSTHAFWSNLVRSVSDTVEKMPLWKLQTIAGNDHEFLYRKSQYQGKAITLLPGVAAHLRSFHGLITRLVRSSWVDHVCTITANRQILGKHPRLDEFLFGSQRASLAALRPILVEAQSARCFYCNGGIRSSGEIDHFIPWSRYPADYGHNFVLAHERCNRSKSDFLAHPDHLEHWVERNRRHGGELGKRFTEVGFQDDLECSLLVAEWAYEQGERSGSHVWLRDKVYERLSPEWRKSLIA